MKQNLFWLICWCVITIPVFGQSEMEQKSAIRQNPVSVPKPQGQTPARNSEFQSKYEIRRNPSGTTLPYPAQPVPPRWGGWHQWGAPLNYWYYDDIYLRRGWGYQVPARVYFYEGRKPDTIKSKKNKVRIGLTVGTRDEIGGWMTVGKEFYFKLQMTGKISNDQSIFYLNPSVNFYNASTVWSDQRLGDIEKGWSLYLGLGKEFKNFGINTSLGIGKEEENFQFFDEYYQLSPNGKYSFRNFTDDFVTLSLGITTDYKFISVALDYDPLRKAFYLGAGFNF